MSGILETDEISLLHEIFHPAHLGPMPVTTSTLDR